MKKTYLVALLIAITCTHTVLAQVFVKHNAIGNNDGTSWLNAYTNLDTALSRASTGQIWVAAGTYKPSRIVDNVYQSFLLNKPLALTGGFNGTETSLSQRNIIANHTILSGDIGIEGDNTDNTPRIIIVTGINLDSTTSIDGFTITKAGYPTNGHGYSYDNGGIYISRAGSPVIRNCTVTENSGDDGSGIYVGFSDALLINNKIVNNKGNDGAGIYISYSDCKVQGNKIQLNSCDQGLGGGILIDAYSSPTIANNLIEGNMAGAGGAIAFRGNYSVKVINNIISNNSARLGGAIYIDGPQANIINNLIVNNRATSEGGAIYAEYTGASTLISNTIANNHSDGYAGAMRLGAANFDITNSIFHNNTSAFDKPIKIGIGRVDWFPKFRYCNIQDSINSIDISGPGVTDSIWREGNTAREPLFVDTANYNFHLDTLSPCINQGMPDNGTLELPLNDIDGNTRVNNIIDKGCYEFYNIALNISHLKANPNTIALLYGWRDTTISINVFADVDWEIINPGWVSVNPLMGTGNAALSTFVNANPSANNSRTALLLLSSRQNNIPSVPVKIIQPGSNFVLAHPDTLFIEGDEGDTASFTVYSNTLWFTTGYSPWFTISPSLALYNSKVVVKATINSTGNERTGFVKIAGNSIGVFPQDSIVIIQRLAPYKLCTGGNIQFSSGLTGNLYQWQADTGTGFFNITDNANYTGTNTPSIQLSNIPSQWYGNKYRCMADGISSLIYTIKFQNTWTGTIDNTWENPQNWSCGILPDDNSDVKITAGQVTINSNVIVRSLTVSNNALLNVTPGFSLTVVH